MSLVLFLSAVPGSSFAQQGAAKPTVSMSDRLEARRLFNQAHLAYKEERYEEAILKWQQSYELSKEPLIFESIANAYERLGNMRRALENLKRWREFAPAREVKKLDARLEALATKAKAQEEEERRRADEDRKVKEREAAARAKAEAERLRREEESRALGTTAILGWTLVGVGGALGLGGVALDVVAGLQRPDPTVACAPSGGAQLCLETQRDAIERTNAMAIAGDVGWITGAAAVTGGVVLLLVGTPARGTEPSTASATLAPWAGPSAMGVTLDGHF